MPKLNPLNMESQLRIDKWLWAVRIFKTRSLAAESCKKGKILVNNEPAKPSRLIKEGDEIKWQFKQVVFTYRVIKLTGKRVSAKLKPLYMKDLTPQIEKDKLLRPRIPNLGYRSKGEGRPTKKERRTLDRFKDLTD